MARLWKNIEGTREGKYLVLRRDGTIPEWPYLVLGAADPATPAAIRELAHTSAILGMDPEYVSDLMKLADEFEAWRQANKAGDPDAPKHRTDDPAIIEKMRTGKGA
jgi:hypothetical protein